MPPSASTPFSLPHNFPPSFSFPLSFFISFSTALVLTSATIYVGLHKQLRARTQQSALLREIRRSLDSSLSNQNKKKEKSYSLAATKLFTPSRTRTRTRTTATVSWEERLRAEWNAEVEGLARGVLDGWAAGWKGWSRSGGGRSDEVR